VSATYSFGALRLNYESVGSGVPVMILHGLAGDLHAMNSIFEPIFAGKNYQRIYVDLPGMGDSNAPLDFASSDRILSALAAFISDIAAMNNEKVLLIGYSYGGYLVHALADKLPEKLSGLMMLAPMLIPEHAARTLPEKVAWRQSAEKSAAAQYLSAGIKTANTEFLEKLAKHYALSAQTNTISCELPALILLGRQDTVVGFWNQQMLLTAYPRATWVLLDDAGHNLQMEVPEILSALTENWLKRCESE
jgi:pimeloyl-ACP methyl ester carboxylesterase